MTRGIDDRVMTDSLGDVDRRAYGNPDGDASNSRWPPPSKGPLPPADALPPDLNIFTAHDEADAWAHEHDRVTEELSRVRMLLAGDPTNDDDRGLEGDLIIERAKARRAALRNPRERGRRTSADIDTEVEEALEKRGILTDVRKLQSYQETLTGRLFKAKDNLVRLEWYVKSLPRTDGRP